MSKTKALLAAGFAALALPYALHAGLLDGGGVRVYDGRAITCDTPVPPGRMATVTSYANSTEVRRHGPFLTLRVRNPRAWVWVNVEPAPTRQ